MKLSRRDMTALGVGAAALLGVFVYKARASRATADALAVKDTIPGAIARIDDCERARRSVEAMARELGVRIPDAPMSDQERQVRDTLAELAQKNGLTFRSVRKSADSGRTQAGSKPAQFRLELEGRFDSMMGFLNDLERSTTPFLVCDAQIQTTQRAAQQEAFETAQAQWWWIQATPTPLPQVGQGGSGMVRATVKLQTYLFPEVVLAPKTPTPVPTPAPTKVALKAVAGAKPPPAAPDAKDGKAKMTKGERMMNRGGRQRPAGAKAGREKPAKDAPAASPTPSAPEAKP